MPTDKHRETEVKLRVDDLQVVADALERAGAVLSAGRVYERNVRYDDSRRSLSEKGLVLRLREDTRVRLTYKEEGGSDDGSGILDRLEAEVTVSDFETMQLIIEKLGYSPYLIYEKYRTTYTLDETEITLDEMPYGSFVEIEGDKALIPQVLEQLGLQYAPVMAAGYMELFERVRRYLNLSFEDLTFENFDGVKVPPKAFD